MKTNEQGGPCIRTRMSDVLGAQSLGARPFVLPSSEWAELHAACPLGYAEAKRRGDCENELYQMYCKPVESF